MPDSNDYPHPQAAIWAIGNSIARYQPPIRVRVTEEFAMLGVISGLRLAAGFRVGPEEEIGRSWAHRRSAKWPCRHSKPSRAVRRARKASVKALWRVGGDPDPSGTPEQPRSAVARSAHRSRPASTPRRAGGFALGHAGPEARNTSR
jgi:hypothetical protein